ncbi:MAG: hypothetical protein KBT58_08595, partial [Bizionia sp.]|nr:hypothetical protein [Bizionia sp.]
MPTSNSNTPSSSINIGVNKQGKALVDKIDLHFKHHEVAYYESNIISASAELKGGKQYLSVLDDRKFSLYEEENIKVWFDSELYGSIKTLINDFSESDINVNIILSVFDSTSPILLKLLLDAIKELEESQKISGINVKLFVVLYEFDKTESNDKVSVDEVLKSLEEVIVESDSVIREVYYLDDRNVGQVKLNLD